MDKILLENERIDDLQCKGLKIIQNSKEFCFGTDAVLLANFAQIKKGASVLDLGTGSGIIPILLTGKTDAKQIIGVEIQPYLAQMASRSCALNNIEDRVKIINEDLRKLNLLFKPSSFDAITCNPPYKRAGAGILNEKESISIARHEILCTLEDIISISSQLLRDGGKIFLIHRPERLIDIINLMTNYSIEPKRARFIHPNPQKPPSMVLIEGVKNGGKDFRVLKPLFIYNEDGSYTEDIHRIYNN